MKVLFKAVIALILTFSVIIGIASTKISSTDRYFSPSIIKDTPKIQVAILLDVSNSMDGLIEQAKGQLWNMASIVGRARCNNGITPKIEIALYEYGRSSNSVKDGYVKPISGFTTDLDQLSKSLFSLTTNGGDEYCGQVMYTSLKDLTWDTASTNYKVIFIAGNEDFLQGNVSYIRACTEAKRKGIIINTIYCGDRMAGIREHWNIGNECGLGSYTNINQDAKSEEIDTPYDSVLFTLNEQLNSTYIAYGYDGIANYERQREVDGLNYQMSKSVAAKRVAIKGQASVYKNAGWDLVDAYKSDTTIIAKVDVKTLPESLKNKSDIEIKQLVKERSDKRALIQKEIAAISTQREAYIASEKAKSSTKVASATLETEIEKIIKTQVKLFNMFIQ